MVMIAALAATSIEGETGNDNDPAKKLYESKGFRKVKVCMTEFGVEKIKFEKK